MAVSPDSPTQKLGPILLITDLSPRCDRAMDRAVKLAQEHGVGLIALHVMDTPWLTKLAQPAWRQMQADHVALAQSRLRKDLSHSGMDVEVLVEVGNPLEAIDRIAKERNCSLIVSGTARDETLGRMVLGTTVERLARQSETPLLIVRARPFEPYHRALVATDFSSGSRAAMHAALRLCPGADFTLYHAFDQVAGIYDLDQPTIREETALHHKQAEQFVASFAELSGKAQPAIVVDHGAPSKTLPAYVAEHDVELVVLGTHGVTGIVRTAMGSVAEKLLSALRCDVLIVRQPHCLDA